MSDPTVVPPVPPIPAAPVAQAPQPKKGWFTRLPLWAKIVFILIWPVSVTYGVIVMWKDKKFSNGMRIALTAGAVIFFVWGFSIGGDGGSATSNTVASNSARPSSSSSAASASSQDATASDTSAATAPKEEKTVIEEQPPAEPTIQQLCDSAYGTFDAVSQSGRGDSVVALPAGFTGALVTATHSGSSNFVIFVLDSENQETELLVNEIGAYSGTTFCPAGSNLKITADGSWTITIAPVSTAPLMSAAASGKGDSALLYDGGTAIWKITHDGESNFVVMNTNDGLLINEIGVYTGIIPVSSGPDLVVITADGNWTITPQ